MMVNLEGCQIPCLQRIAEGQADIGPQPFSKRLKRRFARPWNYHVKKWLKRLLNLLLSWYSNFSSNGGSPGVSKSSPPAERLVAGDMVRVRSREEIETTLNHWKELKGCAFLEYMWQYCGTTQRVLQPVERFLDERDYKVKKSQGVVLLEGVICRGTPVFGRCDRCCHLFWREEWLEKVDNPSG